MSVLLLAVLAACHPSLPPSAEPAPAIYYGTDPDRPEHEAVVSLHLVSPGGFAPMPFCSGTLIGERRVLTAAHCLTAVPPLPYVFGVYVGEAPEADPDFAAHVYAVDALAVHPDWDAATLSNDIAVLRLVEAPDETEVRVAPLPAALELTDDDVGRLGDIAGFGFQEDRSYGEKRHVEVPIAGFGCGSLGVCGRLPDRPESQVAYWQPGPPANGGPCNGDSGGPLFFERDGRVYVAGVTSWGGASCEGFGVSTRVDAFEDWVVSRFAPPTLPLEAGLGPTLNEIHPDPAGPDAGGEWVEILNLDVEPVDLDGWLLVDDAGHQIRLPSTVVQPGKARVITGLSWLNNGPERLDLVTPAGHVIETASWEEVEEGTSLNRLVEGDWEAPFVLHPEVPGAVGRESPGARVDGTPW